MTKLSDQSAFFGFGSLVNVNTHNYNVLGFGSIRGWKREWVSSSLRPVSFLSVTKCTNSQIFGVFASTLGIGWDALDERETGYSRQSVHKQDIQSDLQSSDVAIYVGDEDIILRDQSHAILQSYLDVVFHGYLTHFGQDGARAFINTTIGWDRPVLNDRDAPIYPRAQNLLPEELETIDHLMQNIPK